MNAHKLLGKIHKSRIINPLVSSLSGTLASVFFKKASDISFFKNASIAVNPSWIVEICLRLIYLFLFFIFNMLMIKYYILLMKSYSAFIATILNFSLNFFLSAIFGTLFFNEKRNIFWVLGASLIFLGLFLIMADTENEENKKK
ncbi:conserved Plasmodium protein, unknown function [Plasmodium ovale]|uniref:EamA domain-containing protein n=1 Tax=Plasmodium ovale TaxID=36330 RepID=A0A1C3KSY9_PLAOA|nr:conserved Plasmodium protein, unknown function [Plasmodium ovale]